jgi:elongation factor Ts
MVRELRERTGAGMMDCKRALSETGGDPERAIGFLRERGLASAAKRAGQVAAEGLVVAYVAADGRRGALAEVNCETDFVARTEEFQRFAAGVAQAAATGSLPDGVGEGEKLLALAFPGTARTVGDLLSDLGAKIGERLAVRRYARFTVSGPERVERYLHLGGRIGVLMAGAAPSDAVAGSELFQNALHELTMQVAAAKPEYVSRAEVPAEVKERELAIYRTQASNEGKPAQIQERIAQGKLEKFFKDACLLEQPFIRDPERSVEAVLKERAQEAGGEIVVRRFVRFERGEGLAKADACAC